MFNRLEYIIVTFKLIGSQVPASNITLEVSQPTQIINMFHRKAYTFNSDRIKYTYVTPPKISTCIPDVLLAEC